MKKFKSILTAATLLCVSLIASVNLTSCQGEEDEPVVPAAKSVAGTYTADMKCSVMGSESVFEQITFTLVAVDDATVGMTISPFGNPPMQVPEITVPGVAVSGSNGTYTLAATEFSGTTATGKAYSGTTEGSFTDNTLSVKLNLKYGAMPMPMILTFVAPKNN